MPWHQAFLAERVGFEPTARCRVTGFQDQLLKPLGHLSIDKNYNTDIGHFQRHFAETYLHFDGLGAILQNEEICDKKGFFYD